MSNFNCEHCGATCFDSPRGYVTGCEHYPPDVKEVSQEYRDGKPTTPREAGFRSWITGEIVTEYQ